MSRSRSTSLNDSSTSLTLTRMPADQALLELSPPPSETVLPITHPCLSSPPAVAAHTSLLVERLAGYKWIAHTSSSQGTRRPARLKMIWRRCGRSLSRRAIALLSPTVRRRNAPTRKSTAWPRRSLRSGSRSRGTWWHRPGRRKSTRRTCCTVAEIPFGPMLPWFSLSLLHGLAHPCATGWRIVLPHGLVSVLVS